VKVNRSRQSSVLTVTSIPRTLNPGPARGRSGSVWILHNTGSRSSKQSVACPRPLTLRQSATFDRIWDEPRESDQKDRRGGVHNRHEREQQQRPVHKQQRPASAQEEQRWLELQTGYLSLSTDDILRNQTKLLLPAFLLWVSQATLAVGQPSYLTG
jgi:hypothetical protein